MREIKMGRKIYREANYLIVDHGLMAQLEITEWLSNERELISIIVIRDGMGFELYIGNNYDDGTYSEELCVSILGVRSTVLMSDEPTKIVDELLSHLQYITDTADLVIGEHDEQ